MIKTQHDKRRQQGLLTQREVCELAGVSPGSLQYHLRHGWIEAPTAQLDARLYYSEPQAKRIAMYFADRKRWQRGDTTGQEGTP